ncbi:amino acid ABC transporter permease [Galactobacter valiniphilus]|uniref:amino acid ABC transporter permease n=1 Tax=Galactobacter valiniphilus TaxID=2676122 RepID=UPI0037355B0A
MSMTARQRSMTIKAIQLIVLIVAVAALVLATNWDKVSKTFFNFGAVAPMFPDVILVGMRNTVLYTLGAFAFGLVLGLILALMRRSDFGPYRWIATAFIEFFRGVPALLVLLVVGFGVPMAFDVKWPLGVNAVLALGLVSSAYIAETLRAGLQAVPKGQLEAARSLGMPQWRAMITIVIPQAFKIVLPPLTNEIILLTKDSSLVYVLGVMATQYEMTKFANDGINQYNAGITPLVVGGLLYLVLTLPLTALSRWFERRTQATSRAPKASAQAASAKQEEVAA